MAHFQFIQCYILLEGDALLSHQIVSVPTGYRVVDFPDAASVLVLSWSDLEKQMLEYRVYW